MNISEHITDEHRCGLALATLKNLVMYGELEAGDESLRLVHALIEEDGLQFVAGWVESGDSVYMGTLDTVGGQPVVLKYSKESFDNDERVLKRVSYTPDDALSEVESHGTFGPWDPTYTSVPDNVVPLNPELLH